MSPEDDSSRVPFYFAFILVGAILLMGLLYGMLGKKAPDRDHAEATNQESKPTEPAAIAPPSPSADPFAQYRSNGKIIIPTGKLSSLPGYPAGVEFYVQRRDGTIEKSRANDLELLLREQLQSYNDIFRYTREADTQRLIRGERAVKRINALIDRYDGTDMWTTHQYLESIGVYGEH